MSVDEDFAHLNAYIKEHCLELIGVPLELTDIHARFIIYAGLLIHSHGYTDRHLKLLADIARGAEVRTSFVPSADHKKGN